MNKPLVGVLAAVAILAGAPSSHATMAMQKKAKELGFESTNCLYCHGEKMPKKESSTYNDRGNFLIKQKEAKKAKEVDVAWLKEYVEPKK
jgi:CRISPR/Cas system CSM-associated protein Csm4 (group 5 of RAMP superfamily)